MSKGRISYHIDVIEDGSVVLRPEETERANPNVEVKFQPITMTREQAAWLADQINAAQKRTAPACAWCGKPPPAAPKGGTE